jgi:hypothetical protein
MLFILFFIFCNVHDKTFLHKIFFYFAVSYYLYVTGTCLCFFILEIKNQIWHLLGCIKQVTNPQLNINLALLSGWKKLIKRFWINKLNLKHFSKVPFFAISGFESYFNILKYYFFVQRTIFVDIEIAGKFFETSFTLSRWFLYMAIAGKRKA